MSRLLEQAVWDKDWGPSADDRVASFATDVKLLEALQRRGHKTLGPTWRNLYGAAVCRDPNALKNAFSSLTGSGDTGKWKAYYNAHPGRASTYRGRVLVSYSLRDIDDCPKPGKSGGSGGPSEASQRGGPAPWRRKARLLRASDEPPTRRYTLRASVVSGTVSGHYSRSRICTEFQSMMDWFVGWLIG